MRSKAEPPRSTASLRLSLHHLAKQVERHLDACDPDIVPRLFAETSLLVDNVAPTPASAEMHEANRLLRSAAARPGDPGDRHADVARCAIERAVRHRPRC